MSILVNSLGQAKLNLKGKERVANFYEVKPNEQNNDNLNHHILLLDVSGSMYGELDNLKAKLKITLEQLCVDDNNYVSLITYSGHKESEIIAKSVKCDAVSYKMSKIFDIIEEKVQIKGVTVMSEPLEKSIELVKGLADVCDKHHIALFTDGCLVPWEWSHKTEENKCYDVADICSKENILLNAIGFGRWYDRRFLKELVGKTPNGELAHIDDIADYPTTILNMVRKMNEEVSCKLPVENKELYFLNRNAFYENGSCIRALNAKTSNIIVVLDEDYKVDGKVYHSTGDVNEDLFEDLLFSLGWNFIIEEDVEEAESIIAQTGDIAVYELVSNCFSFQEKNKVLTKLQKILYKEEPKFEKGKKVITVLSEEDEPICLLEILHEILEDKDSSLVWSKDIAYKRTSQKQISKEDNIRFKYDDKSFFPINSISIGKDKLNIGVKVTYTGKSYDVDKEILELPCKIYRDYILILNGNINVPTIFAKLSNELFQKFAKENLIKSSKIEDGVTYFEIDLTKLKSTNKRTRKLYTPKELAHALYDFEVTGAKQWAINQLLKELNYSDLDDNETLSEADKKLREYLRIDSTGCYKPLSVETDNLSATEMYNATFKTWAVEKFAKTKEQTKYKDMYANDIDSLEREDAIKYLKDSLKQVKEERSALGDTINIVRLSFGLQNKSPFMWSKTETKSKKATDKFSGQNMVIGEEVVINSTEIDGIRIKETNYNQLLKCN